jgi:hypothetical protein
MCKGCGKCVEFERGGGTGMSDFVGDAKRSDGEKRIRIGLRIAKSPVFMLVRRVMCDPTEVPIAEGGGEYNENYTIFQFRVARPERVCYIKQVSERHCCRL